MLLQSIKQAVQNASISPTAHPGINGVPLAKAWRQSPPFATVLGNKEDGIDHGKVRNPHIPALNRQIGLDQRVLFFCYRIYNKYLAQNHAMS